jgi:hypothetical protein
MVPSYLQVSDQNDLCISHFSHPCYYISYPPWIDHPNNIWWRVQIIVVLTVQFSLVSCRFKYSPWHFVLKHNLCSSLNARGQKYSTKIIFFKHETLIANNVRKMENNITVTMWTTMVQWALKSHCNLATEIHMVTCYKLVCVEANRI